MVTLRAVAPLILAVTILQLAAGLLGVIVPLAMREDGLTPAGVGAAAATYFIGFMLGAWRATYVLERVGHIRVYAACAAAAVVAVIAAHWAISTVEWALARLALGGAVALMFAAVESWLNTVLKAEERGGVIGFYMLCSRLPLAIGPFLAFGLPPSAAEPFMLAAAVMALSILPICFTTATAPEPPKAQPLALRQQYDTAPAAVSATFAAGLINGAVLTLAPLFAAETFGPDAAAPFQAAAWLGSLALQWPAGKLSDRVDRRLVIAGLAGMSGVAALGLGIGGTALPFLAAWIAFAIWGAGGLSFYGIAVAHMADRAEPADMARATAGLLFVWGAGSVLGPVLAGVATQVGGPAAVFWFGGLASLALAGAMAWRRRARTPAPATVKEPFHNKNATSVAAAELAYGGPAAAADHAEPKPAAADA